jgi:Tfp pilus assembly protein PilX
MLIIVMVGISAGVLLSMRRELQVAGEDRERRIAFYAAEYAVAQGMAFLANEIYSTSDGWTGTLTGPTAAVQRQLCQSVGGARPGTDPKPENVWAPFQLAPDGTTLSEWRFCVHNNAEDPEYLNPQVAGSPTGDLNDRRDPHHLITIEAWGRGPQASGNGAIVRLTVTIGGATLNMRLATNSYAQEGVNAAHSGWVGGNELADRVNGSTVSF